MSQTKAQRSAAAKKAAATRKRKAAEKQVQVNRQKSSSNEKAQPGRTGQQAEGLSEYRPKHRPLPSAGLDQHAAEEDRQKARQDQRDEHNRRTGDASR